MNKNRSAKFVAVVCLGINFLASAAAQTALQITSPANGTVVNPGQTVAVTVSPGSAAAYAQVFVVGDYPIGLNTTATSATQFLVSIPNGTNAGNHHLTAIGATSEGMVVPAAAVTIDVEPASTPVSLTIQPSFLNFGFTGEQSPLMTIATFSDGSTMNVSRSQSITFRAQNSSVVQVDSSGNVTAVGPGQTAVTILFMGQTTGAGTTVPQSGPGDLNADGRVDLDDLNILIAALNTPATGPFDARDLNHDGQINALDARILVTLCTKPECAIN